MNLQLDTEVNIYLHKKITTVYMFKKRWWILQTWKIQKNNDFYII